MTTPRVVVGVDVGGPSKGFHAVALRDGAYLDQIASRRAVEIAEWCRGVGASCVGVDSPCRWSVTGRARRAERDLMAERIWCFSTPTIAAAKAHPKGNFLWMLNGAELFGLLQTSYSLFSGEWEERALCFETFPQAVACALAGQVVPAKKKGAVRRGLLERAGLDCARCTSIDKVDAAMCAIAAHSLAVKRFKAYGDAAEGFIVVPKTPFDW